jgi:hypothetical protein
MNNESMKDVLLEAVCQVSLRNAQSHFSNTNKALDVHENGCKRLIHLIFGFLHTAFFVYDSNYVTFFSIVAATLDSHDTKSR